MKVAEVKTVLNFEPVGNEISTRPLLVEKGYITLPTGPGLGMDLDEEALARHPYREFPARHIRQPVGEGP